ncbi:MAG: hypothetical protein IIC94_05955 [Chloroflexi bacterium]|nr:hypothetical protein [Chloroflexota bacterium]
MALIGNFNGIDDIFGSHPPDLEIAAGPTNLVLTGGSVVILTKAGVLLATTSLREFFGSVRTKVGPFEGDNEFLADPTITFDPWSQRFFIAIAAGFPSAPNCPSGPCEFHMLLAVSKDANPSSTTSADWHFYALGITSEEAGILGIDRPVIRSSEEFIVVTAGIEPFPGKPGGILTRVLPKSKIVRGEPVDRDDWVDIRGIHAGLVAIGPGSGGMLPAQHLDRPPNGTFFMMGYHGNCSLTVIGIDDALVAPAISYQVVQATGPAQECAFGPTNPPQPGGPSLAVVNVSGSQGYSVVFRNGSLWAVQFIEGENFGATAIRWVQIDVSDWPAPPRMVQDSVFGTEGAWHTFPAFAVDSSNNMAMVYGRSSDTEFPSAYYTGRLASDPLNTLRPGTLFKAGAASLDTGLGPVDGAERYGDYFGAAIDPVDGTVWLLGQYVKAPACWGSWVAHVSFESSTLSAGLTSEPTAAREPRQHAQGKDSEHPLLVISKFASRPYWHRGHCRSLPAMLLLTDSV